MIWQKRLSTFLLFALLLAACSTPAPTPTPSATATSAPTLTPPRPTPTAGVMPEIRSAPAAQGRLRVIQAAPQIGAVDVYLEQALIAGRLGLGAYTNPVGVEGGTYFLQVVPTGALPSTQILAQTTISVIPDQSFLVLITGTADALTIMVFQEDLTPIPSGKSRLAFIHAVPRGPACTPQVDSQPLNERLDFGQVSASYLFEAVAHRISCYGGETLLADVDTALAPRRMYTAVLIGDVGGGNYRILLFNTAVETPGQVRFIHAGADLPPVNVFIDDQPVATNLAYRQASEWQTQRPRTYQLRVERSDVEAGSRPLVETRLNVNASQVLEVVLLQERGEPTLRILSASLDPTPSLTARLIVFNAAPDAPTVYAMIGGERLPDIPPVTYGTATHVIELPAGMYNLLWSTGEGDNTRTVEFVGEVTFAEGFAYTFIVTGEEGEPFLLADETGIEETTETAFAVSEENATGADTLGLRVINALAEPLDVRVRLNDSTLIERLPAREASGYITVRPDRYTLRVGPAGTSPNTPDYFIGDVSLLNTTRASLILYGPVETMQVSTAGDYAQAVQSGQAILRVIHAVAGQDRLIVSITLPGIVSTREPEIGPEGTPVSYPETPAGRFATYESSAFGPGDTTGFIGLPRGTYDVNVTRTSDSQVVLIVPRLALEGRTLYDLLLLPGSAADTFDVHLLVTEAQP